MLQQVEGAGSAEPRSADQREPVQCILWVYRFPLR
jgi:hypothetical protein